MLPRQLNSLTIDMKFFCTADQDENRYVIFTQLSKCASVVLKWDTTTERVEERYVIDFKN